MKKICGLFFLLAGLVMTTLGCSPPQHAEVVFKNGSIYTVDGQMNKVEAVAISNGKFIAVGTNAQVVPLISESTQVIDLAGKTVVPGLIDSHYHFIGVGKREFNLNLDGATSMQDFLSRIQAEVATKNSGEWVIGRGWMEEDWPSKRFPTCRDLDGVSPDNPVILTRADGHAVVANSQAIKLAGISRKTQDPQGGRILHDKNGNCNGLFLDQAMALVRKHMPSDTTLAMIEKYARKADARALSYGLTQVHDMGTDYQTVELYKKMYTSSDLKIRINAYIHGPGADCNLLLDRGAEHDLFGSRLNIRGIKIVADGALGSRGAALLEPYRDAETSGFLIHKDEEVYPIIKKAAQRGIQMAVHCIGDAANRKILDLFERALLEVPVNEREIADPRFRIEHSQIVHAEDIPRFAQLGITPSMQPSHAIGDLHFAVRRLGLARMPGGYAWRKFIDQGSIVPAGSDAPVEEGNPMLEFFAAAARTDTTGFSAEGWMPEYRMTREEALRSLTIWGAKAAFMEDKIGSIEPGKYADLVVLDRDLMTEPEERLFDIDVLMTVVAGEVVFQKKENLSGTN